MVEAITLELGEVCFILRLDRAAGLGMEWYEKYNNHA